MENVIRMQTLVEVISRVGTDELGKYIPCWRVASDDTEKIPLNVNPAPQDSGSIDFALGIRLDEAVHKCHDERESIASQHIFPF